MKDINFCIIITVIMFIIGLTVILTVLYQLNPFLACIMCIIGNFLIILISIIFIITKKDDV